MDVIFESPNLLERANIAKQDAIRACTLDEARNYFEAIQHYDQTITVIDDILKNISCNTVVWENLIVFRQTYNDRMEELRDHLRNEMIMRMESRKTRRLSRVAFDEKADPSVLRCEPRPVPPDDKQGYSYWLMRVIRTTILSGGFISDDVYVPKSVWTQIGAKFHALGARLTALEHLRILLTTQIFPLEYPDDVHSTEEVTHSFSLFYRELVILQNNLSKPFTYIKEMPVPGQSVAPSPTTQVGRLTSMFSAVGKNVIKYAEVGYSRIGSVMKTRISDLEMASYVSLASELCEKCQILNGWQLFIEKARNEIAAEASKPISRPKHPVAKLDLTSRVAHNVGNASPRKDHVSPRIENVAPQSDLRKAMSANMLDLEESIVCADISSDEQRESQPADIYRADLSVGGSCQIQAAIHVAKFEELLAILANISDFMRNVFCEIILQDLEYLLCRYLKKTRKGLTRMYWDGDDDASAISVGGEEF